MFSGWTFFALFIAGTMTSEQRRSKWFSSLLILMLFPALLVSLSVRDFSSHMGNWIHGFVKTLIR
jgi:hypothetical protein